MRTTISAALLAVVLLLAGALAGHAHPGSGSWRPAVDVEQYRAGAHDSFNTEALEGCPFIARDGRTFFMASNRTGGHGGLDIWVSTRASTSAPWGAPVNAGPGINTAANDFCPTLAADGRTFFFVSTRPGHCGETANADIYRAHRRANGTFTGVTHLGCRVNSAYDEHSPFPVHLSGQGHLLFFSSARPASASDAPGDHDIYQSTRHKNHGYGTAARVRGVNTTFQDGQPNVSSDGRELYFYSNRTGTLGGNDIYVATRGHGTRWTKPVNLGPAVNSTADESRPSLSRDRTTLYFGSSRAGSSDIYVTSRRR